MFAALTGSGASSNPYDTIVEKATDETQTAESWDLLMTIWEKANSEGNTGARNVVQSVQKRFLHRNANVQLYALTLTEALINNCGPALHREVASASFTESLKRLVTDRNAHDRVKKRAASLIKKWAGEFERDEKLGIMSEAYDSLKAKGIRFDESDEPAAGPSASRRDDFDLAKKEEQDLQRAIQESEREAAAAEAARQSRIPQPSQSTPQRQSTPLSNGYVPQTLPGTYPTQKPLPDPELPVTQPVSRARALYDFTPDPSTPGELPFRKGDVIRILEKVYTEWWRGECRGRVGIFPVNWVEVIPDPTREELIREATVEHEVFSRVGEVDRLLELLNRGEEGEEVMELYGQCVSLRPKIQRLIDKYTDRKNEYLEIHSRFVGAERQYVAMQDAARQAYEQQQQHQQHAGYGPPQQQGYYPQQSHHPQGPPQGYQYPAQHGPAQHMQHQIPPAHQPPGIPQNAQQLPFAQPHAHAQAQPQASQHGANPYAQPFQPAQDAQTQSMHAPAQYQPDSQYHPDPQYQAAQAYQQQQSYAQSNAPQPSEPPGSYQPGPIQSQPSASPHPPNQQYRPYSAAPDVQDPNLGYAQPYPAHQASAPRPGYDQSASYSQPDIGSLNIGSGPPVPQQQQYLPQQG